MAEGKFYSVRRAPLIGEENALPPAALAAINDRHFRPAAQRAAIAHALILIILPFPLLIAAPRLVGALSGDTLIVAPDMGLPALGAASLGAALFILAGKLPSAARLVALCAIILWLASAAGFALYLAAGLTDHAYARSDPPRRAMLVEARPSNWRQSAATALLLADGRQIGSNALRARLGDGSRCFLVQKLTGRRGFVWIRWLDASPRPGPGGLSWPIDRATCFSPALLSKMSG